MFEFLFTWIVTMGLSALACLMWLAVYPHDLQNDFRRWFVRLLRTRLVESAPIHPQPHSLDR